MSPLPPGQRGMNFEEFEPGQSIETVGRTITETDIVSFAGSSGDFNQIHMDKEFGKSTGFGRRAAHGLLGLSVASGLAFQTGFMEGTIMALREIKDWRFKLPIFIGDTVRVHLDVLSKKAFPRLGGGLVTMQLTLLNQDDKAVQKGEWVALIASADGT